MSKDGPKPAENDDDDFTKLKYVTLSTIVKIVNHCLTLSNLHYLMGQLETTLHCINFEKIFLNNECELNFSCDYIQYMQLTIRLS